MKRSSKRLLTKFAALAGVLVTLLILTVAMTSCAHEHEYSAWQIERSPSCTVDGLETRTCAGCDEVEQRTIPSTGHTSVTDPAVQATCTSGGKTEGSHCSTCNQILVAQTNTPITDHTISHGECTNCGKVEDGFAALAWYIRCNGTRDDDGNYYIEDSVNSTTYNYFCIYTDSSASTLRFSILTEYDGSTTYAQIEPVKGQSRYEVGMIYQYGSSKHYGFGEVNPGTFSDDNQYIYSFSYSGAYSSLSSNIKELLGVEVNLLLTCVNSILADSDTKVTLADLGFRYY